MRPRNHAISLASGPVVNEKPLQISPKGERTNNLFYVLLIGDPNEGGYIKTGFSSNLPEAVTRESGRGKLLRATVLAAVSCQGGELHEKAVQRYFASIPGLPRDKGQRNVSERFNFGKPLCDYIRWLRSQYFVETGDDSIILDDGTERKIHADGIPRDALVVEFDGWRPTSDRVRPLASPQGSQTDLFSLPEHHFPRRVLTGDDFYTPESLIKIITSGFRSKRIDLDPASHPVANRKVRATRFYQASDNGLLLPWGSVSDPSTVFVNPPFRMLEKFATKLGEELALGHIAECVFLVSVPTLTTQYLAPLLKLCKVLLIFTGRLEFWGPYVDDGNGNGPASGHVLLYFGDRADTFAKHIVDSTSLTDFPATAWFPR